MDFYRTYHAYHVAQPYRIGKPAHGMLHIATLLSVGGPVFAYFGEQSEPAKAAGLYNGEIEIGR